MPHHPALRLIAAHLRLQRAAHPTARRALRPRHRRRHRLPRLAHPAAGVSGACVAAGATSGCGQGQEAGTWQCCGRGISGGAQGAAGRQ